MKNKGPRAIPDFSRQGTRKDAPGTAPRATKTSGTPPRPSAPPPSVKPQATSAKSGQRGQ